MPETSRPQYMSRVKAKLQSITAEAPARVMNPKPHLRTPSETLALARSFL